MVYLKLQQWYFWENKTFPFVNIKFALSLSVANFNSGHKVFTCTSITQCIFHMNEVLKMLPKIDIVGLFY